MIHIGIVSFNTLKDLPSCLRHVKKQSYPHIRVIILDNYSTDNSLKWLKQQKGINLITSKKNLGFGKAHNKIIQFAHLKKNDWYLALNPDVRLDRHYVKQLLAVCRRHRAAWATGKLYKATKQKLLYSVGHGLLRDGYAINVGYNCVDQPQWAKPREIFGAPGAAPLYSAQLIKAISVNGAFFDPEMFMYFEDVDVDWRAQLKGYKCWYAPKAKAIHPGGGFRASLDAEALSNRYRSVLKNAFLLDLVLYNLPVLLVHLIFRLIFSPSAGLAMINKIGHIFIPSQINRTKPQVSREYINHWFAWSKNQPSGQPMHFFDRLGKFWQRTH